MSHQILGKVLEQESEKKTHQEPWFWFVMSPIIVVFIVSSITVTLAVTGADDKVSDNYYKEGRMLAQESTSEAYAKSLGIEAGVKFDLVSGEVIVDFNQDVDVDKITLLVSHPAKSALDHNFTLKKVSASKYRADISSKLEGRWYMRMVSYEVNDSPISNSHVSPNKKLAEQVLNEKESWRLHGEIDFKQSHLTVLN